MLQANCKSRTLARLLMGLFIADSAGWGVHPPPPQPTPIVRKECEKNGYNSWIGITARKRSLRKLCFHMCLSVHRGGCPPVGLGGLPHPLPLGRHPPGRHPPGQTPQGKHHPGQTSPGQTSPCPVHAGIHTPIQCMLGYGQQVGGTHHITLECILVFGIFGSKFETKSVVNYRLKMFKHVWCVGSTLFVKVKYSVRKNTWNTLPFRGSYSVTLDQQL